jgi:hypothetical protein
LQSEIKKIAASKPSSWGSQLDGELHHQHHATSSLFLALLPGIEEEEAPTSTTFSHVNYAPIAFFWRRCRGKRRLLQGEFRTHFLYFVLSFDLLYFYLFHFIKNTKK